MVKIAVIGCGLMGLKIAGEMAYHGHRVKLFDNNIDALNSAHERMEEDKKQLREEGLLPHKNFIGQVLCFSRLEETVKDAEFVFEAVVDEMEIKQDLFERVSHCCSPTAIIGTNSLRLDISAVVERAAYKEVEITPSKYTSPKNIEKVRTLLEKMGKTLFFRSGDEPLILTEEQREARKQARLEQIKNTSGVGYFFESAMPTLAHRGNVPPVQDEDTVSMTENDRDCAICMDRIRDCVLNPCHHMVTCSVCAKSLLNRRDGCPICRKEIGEIIKVYHS